MWLLELSPLPSWITVPVLLVVILYIYLIWPHYFAKQTVTPGPKPHFLLGTLADDKVKGALRSDLENQAKYGTVFLHLRSVDRIRMRLLELSPLPSWITVPVLLVVILYIYLIWPHYFAKQTVIPGPKPHFLLGTLADDKVKGALRSDLENQAKYGTVFLTWVGRTPIINVGDPDLLKEIMLTDFYNFANKPVVVQLDEMKKKSLTVLEGEDWKYVRSLLTPTFSSSKLRQMAPIIHECISRLLSKFAQAEKTGETIDISKVYPCLTMEVILATAFGVAVDTKVHPDDPFVKHAMGVIQGIDKVKPGVTLGAFFPFLRPILGKFKAGILEFDPDGLLSRSLTAIIDQRKQEPQNTKVDLLQLMINAKADDVQPQKSEDGPAVDKDLMSSMTKKRNTGGLSNTEIVAQASTFLLAGFETTNTLLTYLSYLLAYYPDVQERLAEEISDQLMGEHPNYDNVQKLQYLNMCVDECLRLYTPVIRISRRTKEERVLKGFPFPRDSSVTLLLYAVHHNPEYWPDPDTFNPERFSPENKPSIHPFAFVPFAGGPRNCIGKRFGLMEAKMALTSVLQRYRLELAPEMKDKVPLRPKGGNMLLGTMPTFLTVHKR